MASMWTFSQSEVKLAEGNDMWLILRGAKCIQFNGLP